MLCGTPGAKRRSSHLSCRSDWEMRQRSERILSTQEPFWSEGHPLTGETSSPDRFEALRRLNNAIPTYSAAFFSAGRQFTHCRQKTHCSAVQALCLRPTSLAARLNSWSERGGLRPCCSPRRQPLLERTRRPTPPLLPYWSERGGLRPCCSRTGANAEAYAPAAPLDSTYALYKFPLGV